MFSQIAPLEKLALCRGDRRRPSLSLSLSQERSPAYLTAVALLPLTERTSPSLSNPCPPPQSVQKASSTETPVSEERLTSRGLCFYLRCTHLPSCSPTAVCLHIPLLLQRPMALSEHLPPCACDWPACRLPQSRAVFLSLCSSLPSTPAQTRKKDLRSRR